MSLLVLQAALFLECSISTADAFSLLAPQQTKLRSEKVILSRPTTLHAAARASGGRKSGQDDKISSSDAWEPTPCKPEEARLTVIQITDVYTLEHLASVKTLVEETRAKSHGSKVICMITGDFLSPYLLSSVDRGQGMMNALNAIPMDYITWGNHEADIPHKTTCKHVRSFVGKWLNSNMLDHDAMDAQEEFDIVEVCSPDGSNIRKVGLVAVLSNDPKLYEHFKGGAFGGASIDDPWETLTRLQKKLMGPDSEYKCDTIIPLQHLYVPDDHITCKTFDFPVILSGHDHHRVDEVVDGTRLLKPGMDAVYATVLEMIWPDKEAESNMPKVKARFVKTDDWTPDPVLYEQCERAYDVLEPLKKTELAKVPPVFEPLSSTNARGSVCTMGLYICSLLRSSLNLSRNLDQRVDTVLLMGGNIRGGQDYDVGSYFSLEGLEAEIKSDEVISVVDMPGWLLAEGISATHSGDPIPGWMQYDNGIFEDFTQSPPVLTQVAGKPIDHDKIYRVATKISDLTNGQSPPWTEYYKAHPELLPPKGNYVNIQAELMSYFAGNLWQRIWDSLGEKLDEDCDAEMYEKKKMEDPECESVCNAELRLETLDADGDGIISVEEIQDALSDLAGISVDPRELTLAEFVHEFADATGSGEVTVEDLEIFCRELGERYEREKIRQFLSNRSSAANNAGDSTNATVVAK
ncbi:calcineurin-like phosphoesterase [Nitzschia inconspicua]|uniref:Calcineurin-like phosphoesterase n=1 Tax=Nitzschia inconspicua TaxID=303405 RepID=A0A9K3KTK0_9STRA|nr:calcineurin-like phosphoesterase [Nitzschia inconspicua]